MIKLVIFDFDGTIVDSREAYYNSIMKHLAPMGFERERIEGAIELGMNLGETLKGFIPSRLYRWWIRREIMRDVLKEASKVKKCHDVSHIKDIHARKILVSNSLSEFVNPLVRHFKLRKLFSEIFCADDFDDKAKFIKMYLKINGIRPYECFYVGDRVADVKLAKKIGCKIMIVYGKCSWNSKDELLKAKPDFIVPSLEDARRIIGRFKS